MTVGLSGTKGLIFTIFITNYSLNINEDEVDSVFTIPVAELVETSNSTKFRGYSKKPVHEPSIRDYEITAYDTNPRVWGLTAIYTNFVLSLMTEGLEEFKGGRSGIRIKF